MLSVLPQIPAAQVLLQRMRSAEESHYEQRLTITAATATSTQTYRLDFNRKANRLIVDLRDGAHRREIRAANGWVTVYDPSLGQYLVRGVDAKSGLAEKLSAGIGEVDPVLDFILDAGAFNSLLMQLRIISGWEIKKSADSWSLQRSAAGFKVALRMARASYLPKFVEISSPKEHTSWTISYNAPKLLFQVPSSAKLVTRFFAKPSPPKFVDAPAQHVANACEHAYAGLRSAVIQITDVDGTETIYWRQGAMRQDSPSVSWSYMRGNLEVLDRRKKKMFRGACAFGRVPDHLAKFGVRVAPVLRLLVSGQNLLSYLYSPKLSARLAGQMVVKGVPTDILELRAPEIRMQLEIRSDDHLITAFRTEDLDRKGTVVSKSETNLKYLAVNQPISPKTFQLHGATTLPLPK